MGNASFLSRRSQPRRIDQVGSADQTPLHRKERGDQGTEAGRNRVTRHGGLEPDNRRRMGDLPRTGMGSSRRQAVQRESGLIEQSTTVAQDRITQR